MKKKKLKAELSKTKKKLADTKAKLKALESVPKTEPKPKIAANKPGSTLKPVVAKPAKSTVSKRTNAKSVTKS